MKLRETINAIRALAQVGGIEYGRWAPPMYVLLFECALCGMRRQDHRALHLLHARRRIATRRRFFHDHAWETKGQVMGNCTFLPLWAKLLDVPQRTGVSSTHADSRDGRVRGDGQEEAGSRTSTWQGWSARRPKA